MTEEKLYSINFTKENTKFRLTLHYNGTNSYLCVNGTEILRFKTKDSEITPYQLCLDVLELLLVLKQINAVSIVKLLMTPMQNFVLLMFLKI